MPALTVRPAPIATYRLQLMPDAGFDVARTMIPHLVELGVSHLYLSPVLMATNGSVHGYDVISPHAIDLCRGGEREFHRLVDEAHDAGLAILLDIVPNHMSTDLSNRMWRDVVQHGRASGYSRWFDVRWERGNTAVADRLLLPVLDCAVDEHYALGQIEVIRSTDSLSLKIDHQLFPLSTESIVWLFDQIANRIPAGSAHDRLIASRTELSDGLGPGRAAEPARVMNSLLAAAVADPELGDAIDAFLSETAGTEQAMRQVLDRQHYELADWRSAHDQLDRRRFFDVTSLVGVRQEDETVRASSHSRVLQLVRDGWIDALRIDHIDGLADPAGYLEWLRSELPDTWVLVEKILVAAEVLPDDWPVDGTTGYERAAVIDRTLVDPRSWESLEQIAARHTGEQLDHVLLAWAAKAEVLDQLLVSELRHASALARQLPAVSTAAGGHISVVEASVRALAVAMPVYRTYVRPGTTATPTDLEVLRRARERALAAIEGHEQGAAVLDAIVGVFSVGGRTVIAEDFVRCFQQLSGAAMAKGVEDTGFSRNPTLLTFDEVGATPTRPSATVEQFHEEQLRLLGHGQTGLVATSTHDSKRSADARHRLAVLSEIPRQWLEATVALADRLGAMVPDGRRDRNVELGLIEMTLAADPISRERLATVAVKFVRDSRRRTTWAEPDEAHEAAVLDTVDALLCDDVCRTVLDGLLATLVPYGRNNALSATLLAMTVPGVPDLYQGSEVWQLALTDPDNRGLVDQAALRAALRGTGASSWAASSIAADEVGVTKAYLTRRALAVRRAHPDCFAGDEATYTPIRADGAGGAHVVAFRRGASVISVASRLRYRLWEAGGWHETSIELPAGRWTDALGGRSHSGTVQLDDLLGTLPCALLELH